MQPSSTPLLNPGAKYATDSGLRLWQHGRMRHFVKEWREKRGITQEELARAIGLEHKSSVNKIEADREKDLSTRRVNSLAAALQLNNPQDLFRSPEIAVDMVQRRADNPMVGDDPTLGGQDMVNELEKLIEEAADVPPNLIPAARKLLRTLKAVGKPRLTHPQTPAKGR